MKTTFQLADRRYIAATLSDGESHGGLNIIETGLGISTEGNKDQRASAIVKHIFTKTADPDQEVLAILNHIYVESPQADFLRQQSHFIKLNSNVLVPREIQLTDDGFVFTRDLQRAASLAPTTTRLPHAPMTKGREAAVALPPWTPEASSPTSNKVFLVAGRDNRPVDVIKQFIHFCGLSTIDWPEAVALTGESQPHTYTVVKAGIAAAAAVVVIFSPDDLAALKPEFTEDGEDHEKPTGQARPNVLLEAGMAFASAPGKTIFIQTGKMREVSDISGFNWVKLNGKWQSREDFVTRLGTAGAVVKLAKTNLTDTLAGPFQIV